MTTVDDLRHKLELQRLADELGTTPERLDQLGEVPADDLAHLRHQLADGLVAHHAPVFDGFAHASTLVPSGLAARVTRRVIGPALAGRMAGSMSGDRAAAIMGHLDTTFLADACRTLSPAAASQLVPAIDDDHLVATTRELAAREDHATLGRFVDAIDDRRLRVVLDTLAAPRHRLLAGAAADSGAALDRVLQLLTEDERAGLVRAAPDHPDAAANVLVRISPTSRALLLDAIAAQDDDAVVALLDDLTAVLPDAPTLRLAASSLPSRELAAAGRTLDRSPSTSDAIGRLVMAVVDAQPQREDEP